MEKVAVVDLGSNTVKLIVYHIKNFKIKKNYENAKYLRLINEVEEGRLSERGIKKLIETLKEFKEELSRAKPNHILGIATYVLRVIKNKEEVLEKVNEILPVTVLSGKEEAYYAALGAILDTKIEKGIVFDIGGGSLEICDIEKERPIHCKSYPLGTLMFKEFVENGKLNTIKVRWKIRKYVNPYDFTNFETKRLVGTGGSIRAIKKISRTKRVKKKKLKEICEELSKLSPSEINKKFGINLERAKTVTVAAIVASELLEIFRAKELVISKYGIREGLIYERVIKDEK